MLPILRIGPLALQVPGLFLLLGVWLGLALSEKEAARLSRSPASIVDPARLNSDLVYNLALTALIAGLIGARVAYVLRHLSAYLRDPLGVVSLNPATLLVVEGCLIAAAAALQYGRRRQMPLRPTLDALAPAAAVLGFALAAAHWASGDAFGAPADVPWRIFLWDDYRHPSQVYELIGALVVFVAWSIATRRGWLPPGSGLAFVLVIGLSAAARVFLEAFRGDSRLIFGGWRAAQLAGLLVVALCFWLARRWAATPRPPAPPPGG